MRKLVILTITIFLAAGIEATSLFDSTANATLWDLFPVEPAWGRLVGGIKSDADVNAYVSQYVTPLRQIQTACRNEAIPSEIIRASVSSLLDYFSRSLDRLVISADAFQATRRADMLSTVSQITRPLLADAGFEERVSPVFTREAAATWLKQRLEDMLLGAVQHSDFVADKQRLDGALKAWTLRVRNASGYEIRHLIRTTEDITEAQRRVLKYLLDFRASLADISSGPPTPATQNQLPLLERDLVWRVKSMGNGAAGPHKGSDFIGSYISIGIGVLVTALVL